jgi:hypothetical protein
MIICTPREKQGKMSFPSAKYSETSFLRGLLMLGTGFWLRSVQRLAAFRPIFGGFWCNSIISRERYELET